LRAAVRCFASPPTGSRKESWKFQACVRCGRRPERNEFRVGPQIACWQYARLNTVDVAASASSAGVII